MRCKIDINFFDKIDTEEKAYWLGFIWSDGYMCIRDRKNNGKLTYEFKLDLAEIDTEHLEKFKKSLQSDFKIKNYKSSSSFGDFRLCRFMIYNKHICETLIKEYELKPKRNSIGSWIHKIPKELIRHFIRGILDADGSFTFYKIHEGKQSKAILSFNCVEELSEYIKVNFIENELISDINRKLYKRHENGDGDVKVLCFSGVPQVTKILDYLYKDCNIYMDRKYKKYEFKFEK